MRMRGGLSTYIAPGLGFARVTAPCDQRPVVGGCKDVQEIPVRSTTSIKSK
jgi:hypothetical protein